MAGWTLVGTEAQTSYNYAEDPHNFAGYCELNLGGPAGSGPMRIDSAGHFIANATAPAATAGSSAGGSPPSPVIVTGANDTAGTITFGSGSAPSTGQLVVVTFSAAFVIPGGGNPHIVAVPANAAAAALGLYPQGASTTGFNLNCTTAPAAGQVNTTYRFSWVAIG